MASASAYALLFLSLPFLAAAQAPTPSPAAAPTPALPNPVEILTEDGRFTTLLTLLTAQGLVPAIGTQLSTVGITLFAPTDAAFNKIASVIPTLSNDTVKTILLYHGLDKYVSFANLDPSENPFETLAPGLTLNFTGGSNDKNVTTGRTNTKVEQALYDSSPLAIFPVEDVLLPPAPAPTPGPAAAPTPAPAAAPTLAPAAAPTPVLPNPAEILTKDGRFKTLLTLLTAQNLVPAIGTQLSTVGITLFAPTDAAFIKIASVIPTLSNDTVKTILLYHGLDKYVSFANLNASKNPFKTLAPGLTLNFTGGSNEKNVTTGRTNTKVEKALYDVSPLAIFPVQDVLLPPAPTPAPPPPPSAAAMERVGWGAIVAGVIACMSLF